jgi:hypothetical protein
MRGGSIQKKGWRSERERRADEMQAEEEERQQRDLNNSFVGSQSIEAREANKVDDVKDIKQILAKTTLAGCDAAPIRHGLSTNTSETRDLPWAG